MSVVLIDCDGVLADFVGPVCRRLQDAGFDRHPDDVKHHEFCETLNAAEMKVFEALSLEEGFCSSLPWYPGAELFLLSLREMSTTVCCVTAPWRGATWTTERRQWLAPHLTPAEVLSVSSKYKHLVRGDVLIEDRSDTALRWVENNPDGIAILIDRPWNQPGWDFTAHPRVRRVNSYSQALREVQDALS